MKRVAIVGADFAPSSMPPALRIRFFARHLAEFGWQPTVITADPSHYEWSVDPENERLLPGTYEVIRTPAMPARLLRKVGIGDLGLRSMWHHWQALAALMGRQRQDLVFVPVPPYAPMLLGRLARLRFGIPYVIDYIDPWVTEYYWKVPKEQRPPKWPLAYAMARLLEPPSLGRVSHIVGVSQGTIDLVVSRYPWLRQVGTTEIPYGAEPADFEYVRAHPRPQPIFDPADGNLHVSYVGACIPAMYGTVRALFRGVCLGLGRSPDLFTRLRLHFVGTSYAPTPDAKRPVLELASAEGVAHLVDERPQRIPYLTALQVLLDSHVLVALGSDEPHYTASKIFPLILARRPLLALFHEASSVVTILRETRAGCAVTFSAERPIGDRVSEIADALEGRLRSLSSEEPAFSAEALERYTTRAMAGRLARAFDTAISSAAP